MPSIMTWYRIMFRRYPKSRATWSTRLLMVHSLRSCTAVQEEVVDAERVNNNNNLCWWLSGRDVTLVSVDLCHGQTHSVEWRGVGSPPTHMFVVFFRMPTVNSYIPENKQEFRVCCWTSLVLPSFTDDDAGQRDVLLHCFCLCVDI